jgi:hypothetical protein
VKALLVLAATITAATAAESWPQFRGTNASGVSTSEKAPLKWNGEKGENVLWKTAIPGLGLSSPVVYGDRIYVTSESCLMQDEPEGTGDSHTR